MTISPEEIIGAAGTDPRTLHAQLMAGQQDRTLGLARAFEDAGQSARQTYEQGRRAHGVLAESFTNDAAAVFDAGTADNKAWRLLGQGGQDMEDTATFLRRAVGALDQAQGVSTAALGRMSTDLDALVRSWSAYLAAHGGQFDPAERQRAVDSGVAVVGATSTTIQNAIDTYDRGLLRDAADLGGRGYLAAGPDGSGFEAAVRDYLERVWDHRGEGLGALGGGAGAVAAALALKNLFKVGTKGTALLRFLNASTQPITDIATFTRNMDAADAALLEFARGKPNGGILRFGVGSTAAKGLGRAFLPLTVVTGAMDAVTGGGYDGGRGWATRGFGAAGAVGAGTLLAAEAGLVALGPVGLGVAGAAVLAYGAWSAGNFIYDHRQQIADFAGKAVDWTGDRLTDAKNWAGDRLADAGHAVENVGHAVEDAGKKTLHTLSFGLFG
jgi:hypothetical protein